MKPIERIGRRERDVVSARREAGYASGQLAHFGGRLEPALRAVLDRLLPGVPPTIDLAAFVDRHADQALGRGDRREGMPPPLELFLRGLAALADDGFAEMTEAEQRDVIARLRHGDDYGELGQFARDFIDRLLDKALTGYLAHPDVWGRIGFAGPAYPEGYAWIGTDEVVARHRHKAGWDKL